MNDQSAPLMRRTPFLLIFLLLALVVAACGDDAGTATTVADDGDGAATETTEVSADTTSPESDELISATFALTNQRAPQYYPFYLADELGFFEEEGLDVEIVVLDGSSATVQQVIAENVEAALSSGPAIAQAVSQGNCLKIYYTYQHRSPFGLSTPEDSGIASVSDLEGQVVGVSDPAGGEVPLVRGIMASAGLTEGEDYEIQAIGDGGPLTIEALESGTVQAYSSSVFDIAAAGSAGIPLVNIVPDEFLYTPAGALVDTCERFDANQDFYARFTRAINKATIWTEGNEEAALAIIATVEPELFEGDGPGAAFYEASLGLNTPPDDFPEDSLLGAHPREAWERYLESVSQGTEEEGALPPGSVDLDELLTDAVLDEANDFDFDALRQQAADYEG